MIDISPKTDRSKNVEAVDSVVDSEWLKSTFIISDKDIIIGSEYSKYIRKNRYFSTADIKFSSTVPGMSMAVNPKPQFTRYCDIRSKGKLKNRPDVSLTTRSDSKGLGMGAYYSEAIDDNQQRIFLRFGVPKYMPLLLWISKSFDIDKAVLHNRGVITSTLIGAIGAVTKFWAIASAPLLTLGMFAANVYTQSNKFYSVKDTMYIYWCTVENILNQMVARRTMVPYVLQDYSYKLSKSQGREQNVSSSYVSGLSELLPDVIDEQTGRISVFTIALRAQAAFNKMYKDDYEKSKDTNFSTDFTGYPLTGDSSHDTYFTNSQGNPSIFTRFIFNKAYETFIQGNPDEEVSLLEQTDNINESSLTTFDPVYTDEKGKPLSLDLETDSFDEKVSANAQAKKGTFDKYKEYMLAEFSEGAAFAVFNVEHTGSVGESFSNSTGPNPIEATFNSIASKARNITNMLSAATDIPIVGETLKFAADAGATILSNASFGIANPLLALAYGVNVTMPKVWESSASSLPRASYKIKLISPYGNAYSQLFNIYLPLAMLLAGSLPRSTGSTSYTSPFVCQLFDRGRVNIQLGMIDSIGITRGTSNLAFTRSGHPNAIDIDLSVANLDEVISVDVNSNGVLTKLISALNPDFSDTPLVSYLNTVTGVDVYSQIYRIPMIRLKLAERIMQVKSVINPDPAAFAAMTVNAMPFGNTLGKGVLGNSQQALQDLMYR